MAAETVALAADHAGLDLKRVLGEALRERGLAVLDLGTDSPQSVDYPDFAARLAEALKDGRAARGVAICGSGIGISIAANRYPWVRAALCHDVTSARLARRHNDANVLALGSRTTSEAVARDCLDAFLDSDFEGGRHQRRIDKLGGPVRPATAGE